MPLISPLMPVPSPRNYRSNLKGIFCYGIKLFFEKVMIMIVYGYWHAVCIEMFHFPPHLTFVSTLSGEIKMANLMRFLFLFWKLVFRFHFSL